MTSEGHVVKDFCIGNTHVKICDDYCRDKTKEEVDEILARIAQKVRIPLLKALGQLDDA